MAIEIKEMIVRAIVDSVTAEHGMKGGQDQGGSGKSIQPYLESLMKSLDQKNER